MDPEPLEEHADPADAAEQAEEWVADPDDQPVVPDPDRLVPIEDVEDDT